jgi:sucrose-6-phosphate hydrolase SacC (GH32 family)
MKVPPHFVNVPLARFMVDQWEWVDECRQEVGYQEAPEWECPGLAHTEVEDSDEQRAIYDAFLKRHEGKHVGGFLCYGCLVKEAHAQFGK